MGFGEGVLASTHILKFGRRPDMHMMINEFICMKLARLLKLPVAEVSLERFGEPVLVVDRFDRRWNGERDERLHLSRRVTSKAKRFLDIAKELPQVKL